jgi:hypothetical protein
MVTGCPYELVMEGFQWAIGDIDLDDDRDGITGPELACWLNGWFHEADPRNPPWRFRAFSPLRPWSSSDLSIWPRAPHVALSQMRIRGPMHAIVCADGRVYDPSRPTSRRLDLYEGRGDLLACVVAEPATIRACVELHSRGALGAR